MTARIPAEATRVLGEGVFCHLASRAHGRPHLTPVVYVEDGGWLWVTTARTSVKARAWRVDPFVAGLVHGPNASVLFRGRIRTYDALDPTSWPAATVRAPRLLRAAARFSVKNARFFAGYAVDAGRVPLAWTPPGRVFAEIELTAGRVHAPDGATTAAWGEWAGGATYAQRYRALPGRPSLDRRVPAGLRRTLGTERHAALALDGAGLLTVIPVRWRRGAAEGVHEAVTPASLAALTRVEASAPAALVVDRASEWRASAMLGMLAQGTARAFLLASGAEGRSALARRVKRFDLREWEGEPLALFRMRPDRVVWWTGWTTGTVTAG